MLKWGCELRVCAAVVLAFWCLSWDDGLDP